MGDLGEGNSDVVHGTEASLQEVQRGVGQRESQVSGSRQRAPGAWRQTGLESNGERFGGVMGGRTGFFAN